MVKALIMIDMMKGYTKQVTNSEKIIKNQEKLIKHFKKRKLPIIWVGFKKNKVPNPIMIKLWGDELKNNPDVVKPVFKESLFDKVIHKSEYSAFYKTDLEKYCKEKQIDELFFCGVFSGVCVHYSAVDAIYRRINATLVTDASATESNKWHKENCKRFKQVIGDIITTNKLLKEI